MGWARTLMLGNLGQQIDIDDIQDDVDRMRLRINAQATVDRSLEQQLAELRVEVTELKLVVGELTRVLVQTGNLSSETAQKIAQAVDDTSSK